MQHQQQGHILYSSSEVCVQLHRETVHGQCCTAQVSRCASDVVMDNAHVESSTFQLTHLNTVAATASAAVTAAKRVADSGHGPPPVPPVSGGRGLTDVITAPPAMR